MIVEGFRQQIDGYTEARTTQTILEKNIGH